MLFCRQFFSSLFCFFLGFPFKTKRHDSTGTGCQYQLVIDDVSVRVSEKSLVFCGALGCQWAGLGGRPVGPDRIDSPEAKSTTTNLCEYF